VEEIEYKHMLSQEEYRRIMEWMECAYAPPVFVQINYFYDTKDYDLHREDVTLRVRQVTGRLYCQCKFESGRGEDTGPKSRTELEREIPSLPKKIDPEAYFDHSRVHDLPTAFLLGCLVTERRVYEVEPGVDVTLDRSHYLGHTDWELEIEFDEDRADRARYWHRRLCPGAGRVEGKRARFMEAHHSLFR
jgi:uncharacterized protein YjbK